MLSLQVILQCVTHVFLEFIATYFPPVKKLNMGIWAKNYEIALYA